MEKASRENEKIYTDEEELYDLMRSCGHILFHSGASKTGQGRILHILDARGSVGQKELQTMLGVKAGSLSEILSKLENEGLIIRSRDPKDRRKVIVEMSEKGRVHAHRYHESSMEKDWFSSLDAAQKKELKTLLQTLLDSWRDI